MQKGFGTIGIIVIILLIGVISVGVVYFGNFKNIRNINSFDDCVKAGYPPIISIPSYCVTLFGGRFVAPVYDDAIISPQKTPKTTSSCIQVITPAKNPKNGECKEFPTPCDVPEGWEKVGSCSKIGMDETEGWKMYKTGKFEFKYPPDIFIKEQEKGFYVFLAGPNVPAQNSDMGIDARFLNGNDQFDTAIENVKKNLINTKVEKIENGVLISGTVGPGYAEGAKVLEALFYYQKGVISFSYTSYSGDLKKESLYRKMLSTFKVVYSK